MNKLRSKQKENNVTTVGLIWRTALKLKNKENYKRKPSSSEVTVRASRQEGSPGGRSETTGKGVYDL